MKSKEGKLHCVTEYTHTTDKRSLYDPVKIGTHTHTTNKFALEANVSGFCDLTHLLIVIE